MTNPQPNLKPVGSEPSRVSKLAADAVGTAKNGVASFVRMMFSALFPATLGVATHYIGRTFFPDFGKPISWATMNIEFALPILLAVIAAAIWLGWQFKRLNDDDTTSDELKHESIVSVICGLLGAVVFGIMVGAWTFYWATIVPLVATWVDAITAGPGGMNSLTRRFSWDRNKH